MRLLSRVLAFLRPILRWEGRVRARNEGRVRWSNPTAGMPDLVGFPAEWIVVEADSESAQGFRYPEHVDCGACGCAVVPQSAVRCARCGVYLHELCAGMANSLDVPSCSWCRPLVRWLA